MPVSRSLSGRLNGPAALNGYETPDRSPGEHENGQIFFGDLNTPNNRAGERRRNGFTEDSEETAVEGTSTDVELTPGRNNSGDEENGTKSDAPKVLAKVGIRDRIGCYTWTWFTMTMATGGMANVLHSSKISLECI